MKIKILFPSLCSSQYVEKLSDRPNVILVFLLWCFFYIFNIYLIADFKAEYTLPAPKIFWIKSISGRKGELQDMSSSL